jgi:iron complex transport system substrate-binding protein
VTHPSRLTRRTLLAGLAATPVLAACGSPSTGGSGSPSTGAGAAGFTYTDARGKVIDVTPVPTNVVAQSSAAAALWDAGIKVKGATYGEFSVEKLATVAPQLLVDMSFDDKTLWYVDAKVEAQVAALCPTLGVHMLGLDLLGVIGSFTDLAVKLGADPAVSASAKSGFDAASATLGEAIKAAAGATVAPLSFDQDNAYVGLASQSPDLAHLAQLGAKFVDATSKPEDYFATISYENLPDYSGDIILVDARNTFTGYRDTAVWKSLPAVKAGRVFDWKPSAPYSYLSNVAVLEGYTRAFASVDS